MRPMSTVDETVRLLAATEVFGELDPARARGGRAAWPCRGTGTAAR